MYWRGPSQASPVNICIYLRGPADQWVAPLIFPKPWQSASFRPAAVQWWRRTFRWADNLRCCLTLSPLEVVAGVEVVTDQVPVRLVAPRQDVGVKSQFGEDQSHYNTWWEYISKVRTVCLGVQCLPRAWTRWEVCRCVSECRAASAGRSSLCPSGWGTPLCGLWSDNQTLNQVKYKVIAMNLMQSIFVLRDCVTSWTDKESLLRPPVTMLPGVPVWWPGPAPHCSVRSPGEFSPKCPARGGQPSQPHLGPEDVVLAELFSQPHVKYLVVVGQVPYRRQTQLKSRNLTDQIILVIFSEHFYWAESGISKLHWSKSNTNTNTAGLLL